MAVTHVIYVLKDPKTGEVRYVGVTKRPLAERLCCHKSEARRGARTHRANWIKGLLAAGAAPTIERLRDVADTERWQDVERRVIADMRRDGTRLVNGTDGGEGTTGRVWLPTEEWRRNMSAAHMGIRPSEQSRAKRSATLKARYADDPLEKQRRQEFGRAVGRSEGARNAAATRMTRIWGDPVLAAEMRARMRGAKARKAASK